MVVVMLMAVVMRVVLVVMVVVVMVVTVLLVTVLRMVAMAAANLCSRSFQRTFLLEVDALIIPFCRSAN